MSRQTIASDRRVSEIERRQRVENVLSIVDEVRSLNFRLRAVADQLHAGSGVSGAMRGVLRDLDQYGPQTVPQLARRRSVSRQHIQAIVNDLLRREFVYLRENPAHKRSRLVEMTAAGHDVFQKMKARENAMLHRESIPASIADLETTEQVLTSLRTWLEAEHKQVSGNNHSH